MTLRKTSLQLVLVIGIVLIAFPFVTNLFSKTNGAEDLTDTFRPVFSDAQVKTASDYIAAVDAMANQLQNKTLPALPPALGMSQDEFNKFLTTNYPDVANGVAQLPTILPRFDALVAGVGSEQSDFEKADAIPTSWLPITVVPWVVLLVGVILTVVAGLGLAANAKGSLRQGGVALVASALVGVVLAFVAIGFNIAAKGRAVDHLTDSLRPFFTTAGAAQTSADMTTVEKMANQLTAKTLPDLAKALKMSDADFHAFLAKNFPKVAAGVDALPTVLPYFRADIDAISANIDNYNKTDAIPWKFLPTASVFWWLLGPGLALILIPGIAFLSGERLTRYGPAVHVRSA